MTGIGALRMNVKDLENEPGPNGFLGSILDSVGCVIIVLKPNGRIVWCNRHCCDFTGYSIEESIGYPTPGCLGTYCGLEREMPTLTYEIERGLAAEDIFKTHIPAIWESLKVTEGK